MVNNTKAPEGGKSCNNVLERNYAFRKTQMSVNYVIKRQSWHQSVDKFLLCYLSQTNIHNWQQKLYWSQKTKDGWVKECRRGGGGGGGGGGGDNISLFLYFFNIFSILLLLPNTLVRSIFDTV